MTPENAKRLIRAAKTFAGCLAAAEILNLDAVTDETVIATATHLEAAFTEVGATLDAIDEE